MKQNEYVPIRAHKALASSPGWFGQPFDGGWR
jgi:hypothetical protein